MRNASQTSGESGFATISKTDAKPETMLILVVEDDAETASYLLRGLGETGHMVHHASDGRDGLQMARESQYDILIVDRMLPHLDGLTLVKTLRDEDDASNKSPPVLFLSALGDVDDRVEGLRAGGDDYLTKPFAFTELLARVEALVRRNDRQAVETGLEVADLRIDSLTREVFRGDQAIQLQPREYRLLEYLMRHHGQVVTRTMLLENVWDYHFDPQTNVIDVHISRLRAKVDRDFDVPLIQTVRGAGYMLRKPES